MSPIEIHLSVITQSAKFAASKGSFVIKNTPNITDVEEDKLELLTGVEIKKDTTLNNEHISFILQDVKNDQYKLSVAVQGSINEKVIGSLHPSNIDRYKLNGWTNFIRNNLWIPFGIGIVPIAGRYLTDTSSY